MMERREDGEHVAVEVAAHRIALGTYELGGRDALDALGAQEGFDGVEGRGGFGEQSRQRENTAATCSEGVMPLLLSRGCRLRVARLRVHPCGP